MYYCTCFFVFLWPLAFFLFVASSAAAAADAADAATAAVAAFTAAASVTAGAEATATCYTQDFVIWLTGLLLSLFFKFFCSNRVFYRYC